MVLIAISHTLPAWAAPARYGQSCRTMLEFVDPELIVERARLSDIHWAQLQEFVTTRGTDPSASLLAREAALERMMETRRAFEHLVEQIRYGQNVTTSVLNRSKKVIKEEYYDKKIRQIGVWGFFKVLGNSLRVTSSLLRVDKMISELDALNITEGLEKAKERVKDGTLGQFIEALEEANAKYAVLIERAESVLAEMQAKIDAIEREMVKGRPPIDRRSAEIIEP